MPLVFIRVAVVTELVSISEVFLFSISDEFLVLIPEVSFVSTMGVLLVFIIMELFLSLEAETLLGGTETTFSVLLSVSEVSFFVLLLIRLCNSQLCPSRDKAVGVSTLGRQEPRTLTINLRRNKFDVFN